MHSRRCKVSEGITTVRHEEIRNGKEPEVQGLDRGEEVRLVKVLVGTLGCIGSHALDGVRSLFLGEPLGGLRVVGEEEPDSNANYHRRNALEEEAEFIS